MRKTMFAAALAMCAAPAFAADGACYDDTAIQDAVAVQGMLSAGAEELTRLAISEGVSREHVYVLGRQMVLIERLHRRLLERRDCAAGDAALERDFSIMKRVFAAFQDGDADLKIEPLKAEAAQALLGEIERHTGVLGAELDKLPKHAAPD
ncbi:MAG TPA: hypothetical protein VFL14_16725 [Xanthomonadales bacterium]|nr:hypothetical protein [Xanthomonadales bacterium]